MTPINRHGAGRGSLLLTMIRAKRLRLVVALAAAMLFAAAPAVRAYCCVALPPVASATLTWGVDGAGHDEPCCCDAPSPSAATDERASLKSVAALAGKLPAPDAVLAPGAPFGHASPAPRLLAHRAPPPEPALRRSPRRLL